MRYKNKTENDVLDDGIYKQLKWNLYFRIYYNLGFSVYFFFFFYNKRLPSDNFAHSVYHWNSLIKRGIKFRVNLRG